jgi:GNAT superfamily N-acetyltransferase
MAATDANYVAAMDREDLLVAGDRNLAAVLRHLGRTTPGADVEDDGALLLISTSPTWPGPYHNAAIRLDNSVSPATVLERAEIFFEPRCSGYCVWIAAHRDADLERIALAAGYAQISATGTPRMVLQHRLAPVPPPPGIALDEVDDDADRLDFLTVTVAAYADAPLPPEAAAAQLASLDSLRGPGVRAVVARRQGRPVAAAMVVVNEDAASVQTVGTIPDARREGLATACTAWAVEAGFGLGAPVVVLEASDAGEPVYTRMGFVEISRYRWCLGPPGR